VSKQRPSDPDASPSAPAGLNPSVEAWRKRVFKNTFTRNGQQRTISGWSVKIQHRGVRRTFSLRSTDRGEAAVEAQAIHQAILTDGWAEAIRVAKESLTRPKLAPLPPETPARRRPASRDWIPRLVRGRYAIPRDEFSVRVQHHGSGHFFPLGTGDSTTAAGRAERIQRVVSRFGWERAFTEFPREVTIALHWATEPLAWTYSTFHTVTDDSAPETSARTAPAGNGPAFAGAVPRPRSIAIVENDHGVFRGLAGLLELPGLRVIQCRDSEEAVARLPAQNPQLTLVSHSLPDQTGEECAERLAALALTGARIVYSVHEDSEALFKSTPGGASGYLLRRTPPAHLLAPIEDLLTNGQLSVATISENVRKYFHNITLTLEAGQYHHELTRLTRREREIMDCLSKGYVDKEIAGALGISTWTVHGHIKNIFEKLGVHSRIEAVLKYLHK